MVTRVEQEMKVDTISGTITAKYPWKPCVRRMVDNQRQAVRVQSTMEEHMHKVGTHGGYVQEMLKSIKEGKVRRLTDSEMTDWHGPVHYITTFAVLKPESVSTKTRVVSNSAMRNARSKLSLNACMWPGPNALCDLYDCLIFWRSVEVALVTDLQKAYQAIHTGPMELHLRRFVFREARDKDWVDYVFTRATFGDVAAGLILEIAKRRVAEMGSGIDPEAAEQLKNYSYVDDSIMGGSAQDVARMRGERTDAGYTGTVPRILAQGAMKVKFMAVSGSDDPWEASQLAGKTLGVQYRLQEDEIFFQIKPGFYAAKAASSDQVREVVLLGGDEVEEMARGTRKFTRRQALSMVMGVYDPLGLASPALLYGKLLLRRLYGPAFKGGWDADLPQDEKSRWAAWFKNLLAPVEAVFPRSTKPKGAVGCPRLAGFGDASSTALCAVVYVIWTDDEGRHHPRVLTGKCRVAPLLGTTIPRGELQALVVLHRLVLAVLEALPYRCISVSTFTDSLCSLGAVHKPSSSLKPFFGNRVLEILRIREQLITLTDELAPISHVPGESNPADLGTRGLVSVGDLGPGSYWQTGPAYLQEDYEKWPRTLTVGDTSESLPPEECVALFGSVADVDGRKGVLGTMVKSASQDNPLGRVLRALGEQVLSREKLEVSVRVLARVLVAVITGRREACSRDPPVKMVECAVDVLVRMATRGSRQALKDGKLRGLGAEDRGRRGLGHGTCAG